MDFLHYQVSDRYRQRPLDELYVTVRRANDASFRVLVDNDFSEIDAHIEWITNLRLEGGFLLSEVQNAYELYRTVLIPILVTELEGPELLRSTRRLNDCLFYTITKFSNYFQSVHERQILDHALRLEGEVAERTKELAESEATYRTLVEEINDGYFVNQDGIIVFANQAFCDLHGCASGEMIGKPYTETLSPDSLDAVRELYERRMAGQETKDLYIYLRRHKDGRHLPTENKVKRILYQGKHAVAGICRDVTERLENERRVREAERLAHIGKLTTSLAHEIRNPLSSVKMNSQIILKNTDFKGNDKRRMEIIVSEISRLEQILDEMLDFARPVRLNLQPAQVTGIIDSCLEVLSEKMKEKEITVRKSYGRNTPVALLDAQKMEQALINVLLNAIDAFSEGGTIRLSVREMNGNGNFLQISVADDGPGISKEDLPYVADPFYSSKKKGTGLGLSNVKKIMEAHGGFLGVVPKKSGGTRVSLTIPLKGGV